MATAFTTLVVCYTWKGGSYGEGELLRGIRNNWQKSKAAVLVETAFSRSLVLFILPQGQHKFANTLVENAWSEDPSVFDGSVGPRPHPISIAAVALAQGVVDYRESRVAHGTCLGALQAIIAEIGENRYSYPLNGKDIIMIEGSRRQLSCELDLMDMGSNYK